MKSNTRTVEALFFEPVADGGQWDLFVNLVNKYGVVPKTIYSESSNTEFSGSLNKVLSKYLLKTGRKLRTSTSPEADIQKNMKQVYHILSLYLGNPPHPKKKFSWYFYDTSKITTVREKTKGKSKLPRLHVTDAPSKLKQGVENVTPIEFARKIIPVDVNDYIAIIHDPRSEYPDHEVYTVEYLGNVPEGRKVKYLSLPLSDLEKYTTWSLLAGEPVWFGANVQEDYERFTGRLDPDMFNYTDVFDTDVSDTKENKMLFGKKTMTHAMIFTGVDAEEDPKGFSANICNEDGKKCGVKNCKVLKYRVENSWGNDVNDGYLSMSKKWFDEHVYEIVVNKKFLPAELIEIYEGEPVVLPLWDPFGAVALLA